MNIPIDRSRIELIGACTIDGAYGLGNAMPWSGEKKGLPGDMSRFKQITKDAPEGMVNLLIAGRITAETMKRLDLGPERLLVSVSRSHQNNEIFRVSSFEEALGLAKMSFMEKHVHKLIFIGGEACWNYAFPFAGKAYLTIATKECPGDKYARLKIPLHSSAELHGFALKNDLLKEEQDAWSPTYHFMDYVHG